jgi:hypothetical protein
VSAKIVAEWMLEQIGDSHRLYQEIIVRKIQATWGDDYVYRNANGNPVISKDVLKEFRKLTEDTLVWERGERAWRRRFEKEKTGRSVD